MIDWIALALGFQRAPINLWSVWPSAEMRALDSALRRIEMNRKSIVEAPAGDCPFCGIEPVRFSVSNGLGNVECVCGAKGPCVDIDGEVTSTRIDVVDSMWKYRAISLWNLGAKGPFLRKGLKHA